MDYKYDLAISLLEEDVQLGWDIVNKLGNPDKIFFFKKDVDEITFKNGASVFSEVFSEQSRFVLVLYREKYGTTDWTAYENSIIQDRFIKTIKTNNSPLMFCKLDDSPKPVWLPDTYIYSNAKDVELLVKVLRKRITDHGGISNPQSAEEKLKLNLAKKRHEEFFRYKSMLNLELADEARAEAANLREKLFIKIERIGKDNNLFFKDNTRHKHSNIPIAILHARIEDVEISLEDHQVAVNALDGAYLEVIIKKDDRSLKYFTKEYYKSIDNIDGWRDIDKSNFSTTDAFVELIFHEIVALLST